MKPGCAVIAALLAHGLPVAHAQDLENDRFLLHVIVADASFEEPRFDAPSVAYFVSEEAQLNNDNIISARTPSPDAVREGYEYRDQLGNGDLIRTYAHIAIDAGAFIVRDPRLLRIQLRSDDLGSPIERTIKLENRSVIAESYRREVGQILRGGDLLFDDFDRAHQAALGAVDFNPIVGNFLQVLRVFKTNLRSDTPLAFAPTGLGDLSAMTGFDDLSLAERWTIQLTLLETLVGAPDREREIVAGKAVRDVAIDVASSMIDQLDFSNPDHGALAVVRPYQILSLMHAENDDCMSLADNAAEALRNAQAISMNWASQRTFLLDWSDCLERMTGYGDGRSIDQIVTDSAQNPFLASQWDNFASQLAPRRPQLNASSGDWADRIKQLGDLATQISQRNN